MSNEDRFIRYLKYSLKHEDTGKLAALRRACGQRLVESRNCQWFTSISTYPADFLTATLAAQYSAEKIRNDRGWPFRGKGNIGMAWALLERIIDVVLSGPHHRLCCPKLNCQLDMFSEA